MRNILIILLTLVIVAAGAFLPEWLLKHDNMPEIKMDYQTVSVTSESSSDYAWRMQQIGEHYYGEGENLLTTFISEIDPNEPGNEAKPQFLGELSRLISDGVLPPELWNMVADGADCWIRYYYLFDGQAVSGFRIAEMVASAYNWKMTLCMDVESGKLARVVYSGKTLIPGEQAAPPGSDSWYDCLRRYADYLGLSSTGLPNREQIGDIAGTRKYYDEHTADKLTAAIAGGTDWLELRAILGSHTLEIAVYDGGK